ncbi:unnamed protein product [Psylliodes chrysocephalus]|uniref:Lipase domain-containing protein n=1 Tax=Psylliodes chrysocephalus TaxID=3402493 RepID=A0A9P0G8G7_9CUCU|nr:unnamed protein product [Psylliodes chrysocephala]
MKIYFVYFASAFLGALSNPHAKDSDIEFFFYSVKNPINGYLTNISNSENVAQTNFSKEKDTVFCIHGWLDKVSSGNCGSIKDNLLQKNDVNVFLVYWDKIANNWLYPVAFSQVESLGHIVATSLKNFMNTSGLDLGKTIMVGHSLGAHISGVAGAALDGQIDQIVALDPAGPLFTTHNTHNRLTTSSAKFVEAIHTCGGRLGYFKQIGHADYYPNGGKSQPMCGFIDLLDGQCSHLKSIEFYAESLLTGNFKAKKCDSYKDFKKGKCDNGEVSYLGEYNVDKRANGTYFLQTNDHPPYAKN